MALAETLVPNGDADDHDSIVLGLREIEEYANGNGSVLDVGTPMERWGGPEGRFRVIPSAGYLAVRYPKPPIIGRN
jgi:hypothetical protein